MAKTPVGPKNVLCPSLVVLVGAKVGGRPNFLTAAHLGIIDSATISVSLGRTHHTNAGIRESGAFSVNIPSARLVERVDYCGLVSGRDTDKAALFEVFYGQLDVPLIGECPLNMECRLLEVIERPSREVFLGEIVETWCEEAVMRGGVPDLGKLDPLLFAMPDKGYWRLMAERFAQAWSVGKGLKVKR